MLVDPDGRSAKGANHIIVQETPDGKYKVVGGVADNDRGIYLDDGKGGKGKRVGTMKTTHSFFDENNDPVNGAILDPKSREGQDFVNKVIKDDPTLLMYMWHATNGEKYDFKEKNINENLPDDEKLKLRYRGSIDVNGEFGSARDFGNYAAGLVAARAGLSWQDARYGFDTYQGFKDDGAVLIPTNFIPAISISPKREAITTIQAQLAGYRTGIRMFKKR